MSTAYCSALAGESVHDDLRAKWNNKTFDGVTSDDLEKYARIVAYKVAYNIGNGLTMDPALNPLQGVTPMTDEAKRLADMLDEMASQWEVGVYSVMPLLVRDAAAALRAQPVPSDMVMVPRRLLEDVRDIVSPRDDGYYQLAWKAINELCEILYAAPIRAPVLRVAPPAAPKEKP